MKRHGGYPVLYLGFFIKKDITQALKKLASHFKDGAPMTIEIILLALSPVFMLFISYEFIKH